MTTYRDIFTPLDEAIAEIRRRREDPMLVRAVSEFLNHDIPAHFNNSAPILYLCRHVATPNFEALRFIEIGKSQNLPLVIGEDSQGTFFANNVLKRALGKLPVVKGIARNQDEIIEYFSVIDFASAEGEPFSSVNTISNGKLIDLHHDLFSHIYPYGVSIVDEAAWIDNHHRDNLLEQYKHTLALLVTQGIMFESYPPEESRLVEEVLLPAFDFITHHLGHKPLIYELIDAQLEEARDWNAYPSVVYRPLKDTFRR